MSIGVGMGNYGEFLPFVPGGGGPAEFFSHGSWKALLASDHVTWEDRGGESPGGEIGSGAAIAWATDADHCFIVAIEQGSPCTYRLYTSTNGGNSFTLSVENTFPAGTTSIDSLFLKFRSSAFRVYVGEPTDGSQGGVKGGEYSSADGTSWTKTGRANALAIYNSVPALIGVENAAGFAASSAHAYYLQNQLVGANIAVLVDSTIITYVNPTAEFQFIKFTLGTATGGTFTLTFNGQTTTPIGYTTNSTVLIAALRALSSWTPELGDAVGPDLFTGITIQMPSYGVDESLIVVNDSALVGDTIDIVEETPAHTGLGTAPNELSLSNNMAAAITADVAMIFGVGASSVPKIFKLINTSTSDVSPSGIMAAFDEVTRLWSRNGNTWVGSAFIDPTGVIPIVTHNQGASWAVATVPGGWSAPDGILDMVVDPVTGVWYLATKDGFTGQVYKPVDDGDNWTAYGGPTFFGDFINLVPINGIAS